MNLRPCTLASLAVVASLASIPPTQDSTRPPVDLDGDSSGELPAKRTLDQWRELLTRPAASLPDPLPAVHWRENLGTALAEARETNRPLFVTLRCLPCKQCAAFDQDVLEGGPRLDPLLARFVTVRLTDARAIDVRLLPVAGFQDLDLSWWGWFLSPDGGVYAIFGGRDEVSDMTRISVSALANTMRRVLEHHYDPRRTADRGDGSPPRLAGEPASPETLPGHASWARRFEERDDRCLHCHQVAEILRQPAIDAGTFDKVRDFEIWPLPENTGITLDRDHGLSVIEVAPDSPAAAAGLRAGDVLAAAGDRVLFGQADLRGVLHRAPRADTRVPLVWWRGAELEMSELVLADGWKRTVLAWRMSVSQGNVGAAPGFFPLRAQGSDRRRLKLAEDAMAVRPFLGRHPSGPAWEAGLRPGHVITAVDGANPAVDGRGFLVWFRPCATDRVRSGRSASRRTDPGPGLTRVRRLPERPCAERDLPVPDRRRSSCPESSSTRSSSHSS